MKVWDADDNRYIDVDTVWSGTLHRQQEDQYSMLDGSAWQLKGSLLTDGAPEERRPTTCIDRTYTSTSRRRGAYGPRRPPAAVACACGRAFTVKQQAKRTKRCTIGTGCQRRSVLDAQQRGKAA